MEERDVTAMRTRLGGGPGPFSGLAPALLIWAAVVYGLVAPAPPAHPRHGVLACTVCPK